MITIPKLRKETNSIKIHNEDLPDNYAWIKQKNWQEVLKNPTKLNDEVANYLTEENAFVKEQLKEKKQYAPSFNGTDESLSLILPLSS